MVVVHCDGVSTVLGIDPANGRPVPSLSFTLAAIEVNAAVDPGTFALD